MSGFTPPLRLIQKAMTSFTDVVAQSFCRLNRPHNLAYPMTLFAQRRALTIIFFFVFAFFFSATGAGARPGDLDESFGPNGTGRAEYSFDSVNAIAIAASVQSDGKIVVAGTCTAGGSSEMCLLRISPDGTPDGDFGNQGRVRLGSASTEAVYSLVLQSDGKILLGGTCRDAEGRANPCIVRLLATGALDLNFNANGRSLPQIALDNGAFSARAITLQSDGRIVIAMVCKNSNGNDRYCALRLNPNGSLDTSYGSLGITVVDVSLAGVVASSATLVEGNKVVIGGHCFTIPSTTSADFCALRLLESGQLDTSFAEQGFAIHGIVNGSSPDVSNHAFMQADGKVVLVGNCPGLVHDVFCMLRLDRHGMPDASFGLQGKVVTTGLRPGRAFSGTLQRDGKVLLAGRCGDNVDRDFCFARYNADGTLDASMGIVVTSIAGEQSATSVLALGTGKNLLIGSCTRSGPTSFCVDRYEGGAMGNALCSLDIDGDGVFNPAVDSLLLTRAALGFTGSNLLAGISFPANAIRKQWRSGDDADIRKFLVSQCAMPLN
jgi:uncharacterized delta-60 repeat protein